MQYGNLDVCSLTFPQTSQSYLTDWIALIPLEIHYLENGSKFGILPKDLNEILDINLLTIWLQI